MNLIKRMITIMGGVSFAITLGIVYIIAPCVVLFYVAYNIIGARQELLGPYHAIFSTLLSIGIPALISAAIIGFIVNYYYSKSRL